MAVVFLKEIIWKRRILLLCVIEIFKKADEAFADFMFMLESYLNEKAAAIPGTYCDCKSKELENVVVNVMKELLR